MEHARGARPRQVSAAAAPTWDRDGDVNMGAVPQDASIRSTNAQEHAPSLHWMARSWLWQRQWKRHRERGIAGRRRWFDGTCGYRKAQCKHLDVVMAAQGKGNKNRGKGTGKGIMHEPMRRMRRRTTTDHKRKRSSRVKEQLTMRGGLVQ